MEKNGANGINGIDGIDGRDGIDGQDGNDGREVELRVESKVLQWKYVDEADTEWRDLIDFSSSPSGNTTSIVNSVNGNTSDLGCYSDGTICTSGTLMNISVNDTQNLDFYVLSDDGSKITLIAASNIGNSEYTTVAWYTASSGNNNYGPVTILGILNTLTEDWTNISSISNYYYDNSGQGYKNIRVTEGETVITDFSDNTTEISGVTRARLLTYEEAYELGCRTTANATNCPAWLYGNLNAEYNSLTPYGYWLSTSYSNTTRVYNIRNTGILANNAPNDTTGRGIRPVITIGR